MSFIDTTGITTLKGLLKEYKEVGVNVILACCNTKVIDSLRQGSFFGSDDKEMYTMSFHTVHSAVSFAIDDAAASVNASSV